MTRARTRESAARLCVCAPGRASSWLTLATDGGVYGGVLVARACFRRRLHRRQRYGRSFDLRQNLPR